MKKVFLFIFIIATAKGLYAQQQQRSPNVLIILADDLGWADLSSYGSTFYETPHLDALAAGGIKFRQGYATCPVCSPTRASLMTGKYPVNTGVTDWIPGRQANGNARPYEQLLAQPTAMQLGLEEKTIAELLLEKGYRTFFAGKWHLGEKEKYWPENQGFQINKGGWSKGSPTGKKNDTTGGYFTPYQNPRLTDGPPGEYITDRLANECIQFLEDNRSSPFLLVYSLYAVHNPLQAPAPLIKKYEAKRRQLRMDEKNVFVKDEAWMKNEPGWRRRTIQDQPVYAAMVENMDDNIGRILAKLRELQLDENTLIIFTSDNGGLSTAEGSPTVNGPLRGGKGWLYEGGIRVPFIMYWKGKLTANAVSDLPITTADIWPTIAELVNSNNRAANDVDGVSVFQMLRDSAKYLNRPLFWHYPHYSNQGGKPGAVIREGDFKLICHFEDSSTVLYNLKEDIGEQHNLVSSQVAKATKMQESLLLWLKVKKALFPLPNPAYNPAANAEYNVQDE